MRHLAAMCLVGVALSAPRAGFRYAYMIPQEHQDQPWSQFNERSDDNNYAWGYEFPGRAHFESKDEAGVVKGSFGYIDAKGSPVIWQYSSHPNSGFQVNTETGQALPQSFERAEPVEVPPVPIVYTRKTEELSPFTFSNAYLVDSVISPLLKQAASAGEVVPAGSSPSGLPQYAVNPEVVEEAGGVSAVAERFGAIPVAAVHDVRGRPSSFAIPQSAFAPVLNHHEQPDITLYALEIPVQ